MPCVADVVVTGLVLLWRVSNLWDYLHFCMEMKKIAWVCDKLTELIVSFCLGLWLDLRKTQILVAIWFLHYSVAISPQYPTSRVDEDLVNQRMFQNCSEKDQLYLGIRC